MKIPGPPRCAFQIRVGPDAASSSIAVLPLRCDMEVPGGQEVIITRRPRHTPFLPERLAISWPAADRLDVLDLKVGNFSLFPDFLLDAHRADETDQDAQLLHKMLVREPCPGSSFAALWSFDLKAAAAEDFHGSWTPLPAIVTGVDGADICQFGHTIPRRVCHAAQDIQLQLRVRSQEPLPAFEALLLGRLRDPG